MRGDVERPFPVGGVEPAPAAPAGRIRNVDVENRLLIHRVSQQNFCPNAENDIYI